MSRFRLPVYDSEELGWRWRQARASLAHFGPLLAFVVLLAAAFVLGGGTQRNALYVAALQLVTIGAFVIFLLTAKRPPDLQDARPLMFMLAGLVGVALLQLIPLPFQWWAALPGRGQVAVGSDLLELPRSFRPLSLAPEATVSALLKFLPPLAVFLIALALPWRTLFSVFSWVALAAGLLSAVLAFAQILAGPSAGLHLYEWQRAPGGVFGNVNHQAIFLLLCLPFVAAIAERARRREASPDRLVMLATPAFVMLAAIAVAGSMAGYILTPFVIVGCILLLRSRLKGVDGRLLAGLIVLAGLAFAVVVSNPRVEGLGQSNYFGGERARSAIHAHTLEAGVDFLPFGSGLGSFRGLYPFYEEQGSIELTFVNQAHSDYLEILLELGLPGALLIIAFLGWWIRQTLTIWRKPSGGGSFQRTKMAASLAVAVVLLHSLAEYPLRTPAVACFIAVCLAIMVRTRRSGREGEIVASDDAESGLGAARPPTRSLSHQ